MHIDISIDDDRWLATVGPEVAIERALGAAAAAAAETLADAELSVVLTGDEEVRRLNRDFRGKDRSTNVLSFPVPGSGPGPRMLGDIVLAFDTVAREADDQGKSLNDHLCHLVVHGFLHLLGYDHETETEADSMEALETGILATLGIADPYTEIESGIAP